MRADYSKESVYLPIRSFGDFIITTTILKINGLSNIPIILPDYFVDLFNSINGSDYYNIIDTISLSNQPAIFELYKVRDKENIARLISDMKILKDTLKPSVNYLLDYRSRRIFFLNLNFSWPNPNENIYNGKAKMLEIYCSSENLIAFPPIAKPVGKPVNILIFPESRVKDKEIAEQVIQSIVEKFDNKITIARFSKQELAPNTVSYSSFAQLIDLIRLADLVISSESLPYHLANFYEKPHFVIYKKSKHFKEYFMTHYMKANRCFSTIDNTGYLNVLSDLEGALNGI
ncbi:hypothetical protein [uncultured Mucilaginibacter sp.]|uniref:hypothetical protein n=1 Tax=uncultured Mucilaginibacter sp. TaxID=797541 RepID=UPI0025D88A23|nr:hypothetical protein [uncultured Mucilaginibacter sp.]